MGYPCLGLRSTLAPKIHGTISEKIREFVNISDEETSRMNCVHGRDVRLGDPECLRLCD